MIPFDSGSPPRGRGVHRHVLVGRLGARPGVGGGELPLRPQGEGRHRHAARAGRSSSRASSPLVEVEGEIVSSTHIRGLVVAGDLGRPTASSARRSSCAAWSCTATSAAARSATRPPTSSPTTTLYPGHGVYACRARRGTARALVAGGGQRRRAPDVRHRPRRARRGLPDRYEGDLYGKELRLAFLERLRGERRFDSVEALVEQMHRDVDGGPRDRRVRRVPSDIVGNRHARSLSRYHSAGSECRRRPHGRGRAARCGALRVSGPPGGRGGHFAPRRWRAASGSSQTSRSSRKGTSRRRPRSARLDEGASELFRTAVVILAAGSERSRRCRTSCSAARTTSGWSR